MYRYFMLKELPVPKVHAQIAVHAIDGITSFNVP